MVKTNTSGVLAAAAGALVAGGLLVLIMLVVRAQPAAAAFPGQNGSLALEALCAPVPAWTIPKGIARSSR